MKKCLIVLNTDKVASQMLSLEVAHFLRARGCEYDFFDFNGVRRDFDFSGFDLVVTLGGDGTVLFASRGAAQFGIPIFPVNLGEFGFIAGIEVGEWKERLEDVFSGGLTPQKFTMLSASIFRAKELVGEFCALNEFVVTSQSPAKMVVLDIRLNSTSLATVKADGIIVSSPTGSTAYSLSAGGPILEPNLGAMILTPLNPFSLSARSIVFGEESLLEVRLASSRVRDVALVADGEVRSELMENDVVQIKKYAHEAVLLGGTRERFYTSLWSKLNWSGGPFFTNSDSE